MSFAKGMRLLAFTHTFTKEEEIVHAITHGIGAVFSIAALVILTVMAAMYGNAWHVVSFTLFGSTMLILYLSSTIVHALPEGRWKRLFEIFDHSAIYFFIAGTYTPFLFLAVRGAIGWTLFGIVWGLALFGTVFKCFFVDRFLYTSTIIYIIMGWLIVFAWKPLVSSLSPNGVLYLVIGGILYTVGAVFYVWRGFKFHHAVWHLFVLGGSVAHFLAVFVLL
ncbi:hemolysin III family protein [Anoxybacillus sp. LAT_35]|uniref:PAQR family membrane homeostasis protein TrhA n=1 Tax=unclassified Anoxybacillus TaxID=2639704 RepID=UPI001EDC1749|nr:MULTISPECIES: hemolysin III family protein [unclassified Anoxybacillus]MCG5026392.1 hemolysin III family protein [Anoxybacillus flavithermus]MCG6196729.1 hemolysin III family protein [Anoxybacillus sp. LAT_38]MCG3084391.1 hemolysin III family protein [Anoxybacillus sp. LAT27]MCG6171068.1 hemolysin III family protein [Anoxybacillus sp. LAT_11]MCG6176100.1 hemolysin III family protein [Anoxybacillus sp. LAT_31]